MAFVANNSVLNIFLYLKLELHGTVDRKLHTSKVDFLVTIDYDALAMTVRVLCYLPNFKVEAPIHKTSDSEKVFPEIPELTYKPPLCMILHNGPI